MTSRTSTVRATSEAQYAAWLGRATPPFEEVRDGVWAIPVPVPRIPIRFTYAYLVIAETESVLVDPGAGTPEAFAAIMDAFVQIGFEPRRLTGIVVTHFHFDHWEGADRLAEATGAWVAVSRVERAWVESLTAENVSHEAVAERMRAWGAPPAEVGILAETDDYGDTLEYAVPRVLLEHGQRLPIAGEELDVLFTPGHSPGHLCLIDRRRNLLFSGDHLLPGISPHVALNPFGPGDPLGQYLDSLDILLELDDPEVLPAHEYRFTGLTPRVAEIRQGIEDRLGELAEILEAHPSATVWEVAQKLTWSRSWDRFNPLSRRMALGEAASHIARLHRARGGREPHATGEAPPAR